MKSIKNKFYLFTILGCVIIGGSCNKSTRVIVPVAQIEVENTPIILPNEVGSTDSLPLPKYLFEKFENWQIEKKKLGPISIGMTIRQVDSILYDLSKQEGVALDFGFGGGSPAFIYSLDTIPMLAVVQSLNNKKVFAIVAINSIFKTNSGLHPQMSVSQLLESYPLMNFYLDDMNGWEFCTDDIQKWTFMFCTTSQTQIGKYFSPDKPSKAKKNIATNTWIIIQ